MERKKIKYIGFYDTGESQTDRVCNLAATNKMNYIADTLVEAGYDVQFISPSWMGDQTKVTFELQKTLKIDRHKSVTYCPSWKTRSKFMRNIKILCALIWLFIYLLVTTKKDEKVLAYHVQWISLPVRLAKSIRKFDLVLEVEEIYSDVWKDGLSMKGAELQLIDSANYYIFVSDMLKEKLNKHSSESIVLYGSYCRNKIKKNTEENHSPVKIVYAGSVERLKGGAFNAVSTMKYLPTKYRLYVLGHGSENNIKNLKSLIKEINSQKNYQTVTYLGTLHGDEYSKILTECDIAINPQNVGDYMNTAFPSKVISYLAHNLRVVTTRIVSIEKSSVADLVTFSDNDNPKTIAKAIESISLETKYDSSKAIEKLHKEFSKSLQRLLED